VLYLLFKHFALVSQSDISSSMGWPWYWKLCCGISYVHQKFYIFIL